MILGFWKVLGVVAPRFPILKEWAYAGMFFTMIGAAASHLAVGDPAVMLVAPIVFTGLVLASWALRPPPRRDDPSVALTPPKSRKLWAKTSARNRHERNETNQRPYPNSATIKENLMPRIKTVRGIENRRVVSPKEWLPPGRSFS